jgi:hypothetical protein
MLHSAKLRMQLWRAAAGWLLIIIGELRLFTVPPLTWNKVRGCFNPQACKEPARVRGIFCHSNQQVHSQSSSSACWPPPRGQPLAPSCRPALRADPHDGGVLIKDWARFYLHYRKIIHLAATPGLDARVQAYGASPDFLFVVGTNCFAHLMSGR